MDSQNRFVRSVKITQDSAAADPAGAALQARLGHLARPAVQLRPAAARGFTRLGGLPDLPAALAWPDFRGRPQAFLAQIDLAELHAAHASFLPSEGQLHFFYDQHQGVWGFDPKDAGGWHVHYSRDPHGTLRERPAPDALAAGARFAPFPVAPHVISVLPGPDRLPPEVFDRERDGDAYEALRSAAFGRDRRHQLLGYPTPVQNDAMELECQLASNGVYVGNSAGYQDPRAEALTPGAADWRLLLQLDSDDTPGFMWGDAGTLYFWIREDDARRADFSKTWLVFQCA